MSEQPRRRYGGQSFDDRRAERRDRLIRAAVHVYARAGTEGASVAAICAEGGLTARYFYESFVNRDALFVAAFRKVRDDLVALVASSAGAADPVAGALTGLFAALAAHPEPARVFLLDLDEHDPAVHAVGREGAELLGALLAPDTTSALARSGAVGAVLAIARRWVAGNYREPLSEVVKVALPFAMAALDPPSK